MFEQVAGELRAKLMGDGGAWSGFEAKHKHTSAHQVPLVWRVPEGPEGTGGLRDRPLRAKLACGDLAGGTPPTGTNTQTQTLSHKHIGTTKPPGR